MKISEFKQFIREEIQAVLKEEAPKPRYKKDDKFSYRGMSYTVLSDDGYVVKAVDKNGDKAMYNYNQLNAGVYKKPDYLNYINEEGEMKEYTFEYAYWYGEDDYDFDDVTVKARNEEEARDLAYTKAKKEHQSVRTSKEKFKLVSTK